MSDEQTGTEVTSQSFEYHHEWLDGSIADEITVHLKPLTDDLVLRWLASVQVVAAYDKKNGEVLDIDVPDAEAVLARIFNAICEDGRDLPDAEKAAILSKTVLNVEAERLLFRRGDPKAPEPGVTAIGVTYWAPGQVWTPNTEVEVGQTLDSTGRKYKVVKGGLTGAQAPSPDRAASQVSGTAILEQVGNAGEEKEAIIYFRSPNAEDTRHWQRSTNKPQVERDGKGRAERAVTSPDVPAIQNLLLGNDLKKMIPLYHGHSGHDGLVPFLHLYKAAQELFAEVKDLGKSLERLKRASPTG